MANENEVKFRITADDEASPQIDKTADNVEDAGGRMEKAGKKVTVSWKDAEDASKKFGTAFAVVAAAITAIGISSINSAREQIAVNKETESILAATGGVAGVTRTQVDALANALSRQTNFTDDAVQSAENMLLTFNKIGKDVFPMATETALNMAQKFGGDASSAAVQLGKALQNPIVGITALTRVGVSFTEQQQNQIKTLVESGKSLEAQKIILDALNKDNGLANLAKNAADPLTQMNNQIGEISEALGMRLVPFVNMAATAFLDWMDSMGGAEGIITSLQNGLIAIAPWIPFIAGAIAGALVPAMYSLAASIASTLLTLAPFMAAGALLVGLGTALYAAWQFAPGLFWLLAGAIAGLALGLTVALLPAIMAQIAAWGTWAVTVWAALAPILALAAAFAFAGAALAVLGFTIYTFRDNIINAFYTMRDAVVETWTTMTGGLSTAWTAVSEYLFGGFEILGGLFGEMLEGMWTLTKDIFGGIAQFMLGTLQFLIAVFTGGGKEKMEAAWNMMLGGLTNIAIGIMNSFIDTIEIGVNAAIHLVNKMANQIKKIPMIGDALAGFTDIGDVTLERIAKVEVGSAGLASFIGDDFKKSFDTAMSQVKNAFAGLTDPTGGAGPGGSGGSGGSGSDEEQKKRDAALKAEIEGNVKQISTNMKQAQDDRNALQNQIKKIDDELAREKHDGVKQNTQLIAQRALLQKEQAAKDAEIQKLQKQLDRSNTDLAAQQQKEIDRQKAVDAKQQQFGGIDDIIQAQKLSEADAAEAKRKADAAKKKNESASSSSAATAPSTPTVMDGIPIPTSPGPTIPGLTSSEQAQLNAGGIVLLDLNNTGPKTYIIDIHDNSFYGDDKSFAQKVGDRIVQELGLHITSPAT